MGGPGSGRKKGVKTRFNTGSNTKKNKAAYRKKIKAGAKVMLAKYKKVAE
jgi:hypothetical protein